MLFPYGEWSVLALGLVAWAEKLPVRRLVYLLGAAWFVGKTVEVFFPAVSPWHWHYGRIAVILVFWFFAWHKAKWQVLPLMLTLTGLFTVDLFLLNKPGIIPYEEWLLPLLLLLIAGFSSLSFWGMAAAFSGAILINQGMVIFFYGGITTHAELPEPFLWHFGTVALVLAGIMRAAWQKYAVRCPESDSELEISKEMPDGEIQ